MSRTVEATIHLDGPDINTATTLTGGSHKQLAYKIIHHITGLDAADNHTIRIQEPDKTTMAFKTNKAWFVENDCETELSTEIIALTEEDGSVESFDLIYQTYLEKAAKWGT